MQHVPAKTTSLRHVKIGALVSDVATKNPLSAPDDEFAYVDLSAVDQTEKIVTAPRKMIGREAPSRARQIIAKDDILVSTVRPNLNAVARVEESLDGAIASTGFCVLRPHPRDLDSRYLFQWVRTPDFVSAMTCLATGASYPAITDRIVRDSLIPLPSLAEQRRIAAILDQADALRAKRRAALAQLDEMAQAIFVEMFGDPSANKRNWKQALCSDLCERITVGVVVKPASYYCDYGVPAIRGTNIKRHGIDLNDLVYFSYENNNGILAKSKIRAGDLLVVRTGQPGMCAIVPETLDGANAIDVIIVTTDRTLIHPIFLRELLNSSSGRQMILAQSRGQIQQHFNVGSLSDAKIIAPPLSLQADFARRVEAIADCRTSSVKALKETEALFASLQHRAFRGEL